MKRTPEKGLKVIVRANREAVFGEDEVKIKKVDLTKTNVSGILTGNVIAGYCEVDTSSYDGKKHWYPIDQLYTESGEQLEEEDMEFDLDRLKE